MQSMRYEEVSDKVRVSETDGSFHKDAAVPRGAATEAGFSPSCKGCPHIRTSVAKGKHCVYVVTPKHHRFPCFFKTNVAKGGWDGKYGKSVIEKWAKRDKKKV